MSRADQRLSAGELGVNFDMFSEKQETLRSRWGSKDVIGGPA